MKNRIWMLIGLVSFTLAACDQPVRATALPTSEPGPSQTWIDAPLHNSTLPLLPYTIVFHSASFVGVTEFEIQINGVAVATVPPLAAGSGGSQYGTLFMSEYNWNPPAPGTYLIKVQAKGNGQFSPPDQVQVIIKGGKSTDIPIKSIPTPTETLVEVKACTFTAIINLFCRRGPGMKYIELDNFIPGQIAPVVGQSTDGYFWYVTGPNYGELCTVPNTERHGEMDGECDGLLRFTPIPLPTQTPTRPLPTPTPTPCPAGVPCP